MPSLVSANKKRLSCLINYLLDQGEKLPMTSLNACKNYMYMVTMDYFSNYWEVDHLSSAIKGLKATIDGYPEA